MSNTSLNNRFIAITGGIGSGKSTICRILEILGYAVFYTDKSAQEQINGNPTVIRKIRQAVGEDIYRTDNSIDKDKLAGIIFNDKGALETINAIVHPAVWQDFLSWSSRQTSSRIFLESAILFECGWNRFFKNIICVTARLETRIARTAVRDKKDPEIIKKRIENQFADEQKIAGSTYIIHTDDEYSEL